MMPRFALLFFACCIAVFCAKQAEAAPPDLGRTPAEPFSQAHQAIQQAQTTTIFTFYYTPGEETCLDLHTYRLAFDRPTQRLRIERPGFTLVCDGQHLTLTSPMIAGRYLRTPMTGELTFEKLAVAVPDLAQPLPIELILLLQDNPAPYLSKGNSPDFTLIKPDKRDPENRPRLQTLGPDGTLTIFAGTNTWRIDEAMLVADPKQLANTGLSDARYHYDVSWDVIDKPIDEDQFALDTQGLQEVNSMQAFLAPPAVTAGPSGGNGQAGGGGTSGGGNTLLGLELPDIELEVLDEDQTLNLKELAEEVSENDGLLIVEFYANWCRPSVLDVPALAQFQKWCEENEKPVTIVLVAVQQKSKQTREWLEQLEANTQAELNLTVLLDPAGETAQALKLPTIPRTFIVSEGKIVDVLGGIKPTFAEDLKQRVATYLDKESN